jgi:hypothetical protein
VFWRGKESSEAVPFDRDFTSEVMCASLPLATRLVGFGKPDLPASKAQRLNPLRPRCRRQSDHAGGRHVLGRPLWKLCRPLWPQLGPEYSYPRLDQAGDGRRSQELLRADGTAGTEKIGLAPDSGSDREGGEGCLHVLSFPIVVLERNRIV